jgi:hypothetical protein
MLRGLWTVYAAAAAVPVAAARRRQNGSLVFWLRPFRREPVRRPGFPVILASACAGISTPVTLQDDRHPHAPEIGFYRNLDFHLTIFVAPLLFGLILCVPLYFLLQNVPVTGIVILGLVLGPCLGIGLGVLMKSRQRRAGICRLMSDSPEAELPAVLRRLSAGRGRAAGAAGVAVITLPARNWRAAVLKTLEHSALVVIETTDVTEDLAWEISAALKQLPPERIVIASGAGDQQSEEACRESMRQRIGKVAGAELMPRFPLFVYPEFVSRRRLWMPRPKFGSALRALIHQGRCDKPLAAPTS